MNNSRNQSDLTKNKVLTTDSEPQAGLREWIGLVILAFPTLLMSLDISVLYLALPHLTIDLAPSSTQMLWIVDIYAFMLAGFLITMGKLGDRIGRRKLLMIGASAFGAASVLAAYSISAEMLIITRALLGIAGATLMPSTLSLISNMFRNPNQRAIAISIWMICFTLGSVIGPVVGGMMLEKFWWGSVFLLGVPVMVLLLVTAPFLLPEYRDPQGGRLDLISSVLSLAAILPFVYGIKSIAKDGLQLLSILVIVIGLAIGWVFVHRQRKVADPLLDLRLFSSRAISGALCIMLLGLLTLSGLNLYIAQYLQLVEGLSPLLAGLWLIPMAIGVIIGSVAAPLIARRVPKAYVIAIGLVIASAGFLTLAQVEATSSLSILVTSSVIFSIGISPLIALSTDLIVGSAPPEKAGSAAAMSEASSELGVALGIAILGSIATAVYRNLMVDSLSAELSPVAAEAALDSLASAIAIAESLPTSVAAKLLASARDAFTSGLTTIATISAILVAGLAILTVVLLRNVRPNDKAVGETTDNLKEKEITQ